MLSGLVKGQRNKKSLKSKEGLIVKDENFYKKVEEKAYQIYEQHGCSHGSDWADWFQAEKEIESLLLASASEHKPKRSAKRF